MTNNVIIKHKPLVVIKFEEDVSIPYVDGIEKFIAEKKLAPWEEFTSTYPNMTIRRLFRMEENEIRSLINKASNMDPTYDPINLLTFFVIECPIYSNPHKIAEAISSWRIVEYAYYSPPSQTLSINPDNDPLSEFQEYLNPSPVGIDARYVWQQFPEGAGGQGQKLVDIEYGFRPTHNDLINHNISIINGENSPDWSHISHGTSVLGVICAVDNDILHIGIAPKIDRVYFSSVYDSNRPDAIMSAIRNLSSGDIILIEIGIDIVNAEDEVIYNEMCVEVEDVTFHTIRLATALGICVIEGAGNSGANLDDFVHPIHRTRILDRSAGPTSGFRDSGAILVGASMPSQPYESHPRLIINNLGSNYGSRIDCFAWGRWVDTIGSSSDNPDNHYVTNFGGTSSASAIVAGAALSVQGINQSINGYRFSPLGLRMILSDQSINTHSENPSYDRIGVMPDLRRITNDLLELHSVDIYMRDNIDDTGDHSVGPLASSPDIILKTVEVMNPQEEFGEESIGVNSNTLSDQVNPGQDNFVYLRVRNRGMDDAFNTFAQVYWSPPATLPTPNLWHLIGTVNIANIPADNYLMVSNPVTWHSSDIPGAGHYCFIALIGNDLDPAPLLTEPPATDFMTWENYTTFVRNNNNVVWRNFNIVDNAPEESGFIPLDFLATGAPDRDLVMSLEVISKLPHGSKAFLMLGMRTARLFSLLLRRTNSIIPNNGNIMIPINIHGKFVIGDALFHKQVKIPLKILLYIPEKKHISTYTIYVRQLFEGDEVGRITWQLSKIEET